MGDIVDFICKVFKKKEDHGSLRCPKFAAGSQTLALFLVLLHNLTKVVIMHQSLEDIKDELGSDHESAGIFPEKHTWQTSREIKMARGVGCETNIVWRRNDNVQKERGRNLLD